MLIKLPIIKILQLLSFSTLFLLYGPFFLRSRRHCTCSALQSIYTFLLKFCNSRYFSGAWLVENYEHYASRKFPLPEVNKALSLCNCIRLTYVYYFYKSLLYQAYHNGNGSYVPSLAAKIDQASSILRDTFLVQPHELEKFAKINGLDLSALRVINWEWTALIGHLSHLDIHFKMKECGLWSGHSIIITCPEKISNRYYLDLFKVYCQIFVRDENLSQKEWLMFELMRPLYSVSYQYFKSSGKFAYWNDSGAAALKLYDSKYSNYKVRDQYNIELLHRKVQFHKKLSSLGVREDQWYVCLHIREPESRFEQPGSGETLRNMTLSSYLPAIDYIRSQGGCIIKLGSPMTPPLSNNSLLIDYPHSGYVSEQMDIDLIANCKYMIGTTSGLAYVATVLNVPLLVVNAISSMGLLWNKRARFILKHVFHGKNELTVKQICSDSFRWAYPTYFALQKNNLTVRDNTAKEILDAVSSMHHHVVNEDDNTYSEGEKLWLSMNSQNNFFASSLPSRSVLSTMNGNYYK